MNAPRPPRSDLQVGKKPAVNRRCTAGALFLLLLAGARAGADDRALVLTADEFDANLDFRERSVELLPQAGDPEAPRIVIEKPDIGADVAAPVDVSVRFETAGDAEIDIDTLRIRYGWFDITQRVRDSMEVTGDGISGKITSMRNGKHTLKVTISDSFKREGKASIVFHVVGT